jgi:heavy metal sensor kinase
LLGVPLIAFALVCYIVFARTLQTRTDRFIGDALTAFSREVGAERRAALTVVQAMRSTSEEIRFRDLHIAILDDSGRIVAASDAGENEAAPLARRAPNAGVRTLAALQALDPRQAQMLTVRETDGNYRVVVRPLVVAGQSFALSAAYSLGDNEAVLARIREMFLVAIPMLMLCAAAGGYVLAKRSLAPVASMAARAAEIGASNLHERLPVGGGDELVGLAQVVNGLLDRLELSFAQQRQFVADASHELRTPTAIVRAEADITLSRAHRDEAEYRASVTIMQDAARRLARIVDDLFLLARADSSQLVAHRAPLYLEELLIDVTRGLRSVADRRGVHIELHLLADAPFLGDADMLGRLLLNLLDNAIKYSAEGGTVDVQMVRGDGRYEISVVDEGDGIPPELHERVFERFYRADTSRSRNESSATSGAGLGLAIARRIAELHGGRLELAESRPGRTEFLVVLPGGTG